MYNMLLLCDTGESENNLHHTYENRWLVKVNQLLKLRLYKDMKTNFRPENYLFRNIYKISKIATCTIKMWYTTKQSRNGTIHGGRLGDSICSPCSSDCVEGECHLLLYCTVYQYSNLRTEFYQYLVLVVTPHYVCQIQIVLFFHQRISLDKSIDLYIQLKSTDNLRCTKIVMRNYCFCIL